MAILGQELSEFIRGSRGRSCRDDGHEAINVLNRVVQIGRNANFGFAEADEDVLFAELVIKLGGFFGSASDEAAVGAAEFSIEGTGGDAAIDRQAREKGINQDV